MLMTDPMHDPSHLLNFVASMPARYARAFDWLAVGEHAQIVFARGQKPVNVGLFTSLKRGRAGLCVVAPDRPGLLLDICAGFDLYDLDVVEAEIFTRHASPSLNEAVDLFWIRRRPPNQQKEVTQADLGPLREILTSLVSGNRERAATRDSFVIRTPAASSRLFDLSTIPRAVSPRSRSKPTIAQGSCWPFARRC